MSNVNIKRVVENIRSGTNSYTPLVEIVVNAIEAIERTGNTEGKVEITIHRTPQTDLDDAIPDIEGFSVTDNGIGFNEEHRESFDTLYTAQKISQGGKGFGRFICLKYFDSVQIQSVYQDGREFICRKFKMGKDTEIIVDETASRTNNKQTGTTVELTHIKKRFPDKGIPTIARTLVERLLPYFISEECSCPRILLQNERDSDPVCLNDYLSEPNDSLIFEVKSAGGDFVLEATEDPKTFSANVFKLYSPKATRSRISLVAHRREVTSTSLHNYIPEFSEEFYDEISIREHTRERNFIVAVYVFGDYLDEHVSIERAGFEFHKDNDLMLGISQKDIEEPAAEYARGAVAQDVSDRQTRKAQRIRDYVRDNAPWHAEILNDLDFSQVPYNPTNEEVETHLHHQKYTREIAVKGEVRELLASQAPEDLRENAAEIVSRISGTSRSELIHYVALRRSVLEIFDRSLTLDQGGSYSSEDLVHDIIFPRRRNSEDTLFGEHNLWIVDERLNFTEYLSSDLALDGARGDRPDILVFDKRIGFRGDNNPSNPVTIFEFKRPHRDDFVNPSSKEDPVQQIVRYVIQIKDGKYTTPRGREIQVADNTPFYGYVICDLTSKVRNWVENEKDFRPMPDGLGYFNWHEKLNLYLEVLSWDKILKDAVMRNRIFFHKLGIE